VKRSGGGAEARAQHAKKRMAADRAFDILLYWCGFVPTLSSSDNAYFDLTALLYEIATGRSAGKEPVYVERACREHFKVLERDGFPSTAERRQQRRQWSKHLRPLDTATREGKTPEPRRGPSTAAIQGIAVASTTAKK
jgi:hypothetical protein